MPSNSKITEFRQPEPAANPGRRKSRRDITWDRPIFRPPELLPTQPVNEPLPFRPQSFTGHRMAGR
jgi:hypothetical protein